MGGTGLVSQEGRSIHPTAMAAHMNRADGIIPKFQRVAELVHEFPVPVMVQLGYQGRRFGIRQRQVLDGDRLALAILPRCPTPGFGYVQAMPHEMSIDEVEEIVDAFGKAAGKSTQRRPGRRGGPWSGYTGL